MCFVLVMMLPPEVMNMVCSFLRNRPAIRGLKPEHSAKAIELLKDHSFNSFLDVIHYVMEYELDCDDHVERYRNRDIMHVTNVMEQKLCPTYCLYDVTESCYWLALFPCMRYILMRESMPQLAECAGDVRDILAKAVKITYGHQAQHVFCFRLALCLYCYDRSHRRKERGLIQQ